MTVYMSLSDQWIIVFLRYYQYYTILISLRHIEDILQSGHKLDSLFIFSLYSVSRALLILIHVHGLDGIKLHSKIVVQ